MLSHAEVGGPFIGVKNAMNMDFKRLEPIEDASESSVDRLSGAMSGAAVGAVAGMLLGGPVVGSIVGLGLGTGLAGLAQHFRGERRSDSSAD